MISYNGKTNGVQELVILEGVEIVLGTLVRLMPMTRLVCHSLDCQSKQGIISLERIIETVCMEES